MTRSSRIIWVRALSAVPDLPPCPEDLTECAWARLLFDPVCHARHSPARRRRAYADAALDMRRESGPERPVGTACPRLREMHRGALVGSRLSQTGRALNLISDIRARYSIARNLKATCLITTQWV
jgi:hypothetical protein